MTLIRKTIAVFAQCLQRSQAPARACTHVALITTLRVTWEAEQVMGVEPGCHSPGIEPRHATQHHLCGQHQGPDRKGEGQSPLPLGIAVRLK